MANDIISAVAAAAQIDEARATDVAAILLDFVARQAEEEDVRALFAKVPAAAALARQHVPSSGAGALAGLLGGGGLSAAMSALAALQAQGLDMQQIRAAARALFDSLKALAGEELSGRIAGQLAARVPGMDRLA